MATRGRRPGPSNTREEILVAARQLFARRGYQATTMRAIAAEAGVNAALVHHYFGSKEQLLVAAMNLPLNPADAIRELRDAGPRDQLGERLVRFFVRTWRDPETGQPLQALLRASASSDAGAATMREFVENVMLARLSMLLGIPRLRLAGGFAQLVGFALAGTVIGIEPLASASEDELVALLAPSIQRYVDG
ncbi:MAG TPA: TetR family transcriptional regulator [Jatrophihabitantaceae bacterium]|jgi:AcrR family transcriptional regulator|nr:TetR family transcriptional regulator [Jatrophihabitantaceae bacterium]